MASCGFWWSACFVPCCLSIPARCHMNPRLSHPILPALLQKDLPHSQNLLSYWEHNVHSTPQNPFLNSSLSGDHMWLLSFFRHLGKEMTTVLTQLGRACSCPELQQAGMKTKPNQSELTHPASNTSVSPEMDLAAGGYKVSLDYRGP